MGDSRVSTNVTKPDGSRAVGTKLQGRLTTRSSKEANRFEARRRSSVCRTSRPTTPSGMRQGRPSGSRTWGRRRASSSVLTKRQDRRRIGGPGLGSGVRHAHLRNRATNDGTASLRVRSRPTVLPGRPHGVHDGRPNTTEVRRIVEALGLLGEKLRSTLGQVSGSSLELASAADQLSAVTTQMLEANKRVSAQSEAVASAAEEMSVTVVDVARSTRSVEEASQQALSVASNGARVIESFLGATERIGRVVALAPKRSRQWGPLQEIGGVADLIDDIADQTNLLRSTRPSRLPVPENTAGGLRWWRTRCASSRRRR